MKFSSASALALAAVASAKPCPETPELPKPVERIDLGPRPGYLVDDMDEGPLKEKLKQCLDDTTPWRASTWSVAHRGGATLQMPEHSLQNAMAGARMGAGVLECDTAFTSDLELVCRHSQCDLHYTTDILMRPELAKKCSEPFTPVKDGKPASAKCCTSDITLAEFKTLCAEMEGQNPDATTVEEFHPSTPKWRTDLYGSCATILSLQDHIDLALSLGLLHTPELKTPQVPMPFKGNYTQEKYAQQLVDQYRDSGVPPSNVFLQSFLYDDMLYWLKHEPEYAQNALFLDSYGETAATFPNAVANLTNYKADGVQWIAPPIPYLVAAKDGKMVPSEYAEKAMELGLRILPWSLERSGPLYDVKENGDYYYMYFNDAVNNDGDMYTLLDLLHEEIGIEGIFTDWAATVTFYANCMNIQLL
ncbi:glycerophosphoryl diester phosphodiesterase [Emericellopsis cladophorae]|uniref:glycerophosphodiester phosphodiesterase n=1 Tax=Emericellopsis cladophorae TaxID=2686198 RepID=A0A9Q0BDY9_9HYPO|nr:glycerophosphoryl diester phosphodiesterase [Emericellopsis cladophorae]KAI6781311.1 glycerophosphoryl diester phosphodiesterase [Emericellopsis cladophorae]